MGFFALRASRAGLVVAPLVWPSARARGVACSFFDAAQRLSFVFALHLPLAIAAASALAARCRALRGRATSRRRGRSGSRSGGAVRGSWRWRRCFFLALSSPRAPWRGPRAERHPRGLRRVLATCGRLVPPGAGTPQLGTSSRGDPAPVGSVVVHDPDYAARARGTRCGGSSESQARVLRVSSSASLGALVCRPPRLGASPAARAGSTVQTRQLARLLSSGKPDSVRPLRTARRALTWPHGVSPSAGGSSARRRGGAPATGCDAWSLCTAGSTSPHPPARSAPLLGTAVGRARLEPLRRGEFVVYHSPDDVGRSAEASTAGAHRDVGCEGSFFAAGPRRAKKHNDLRVTHDARAGGEDLRPTRSRIDATVVLVFRTDDGAVANRSAERQRLPLSSARAHSRSSRRASICRCLRSRASRRGRRAASSATASPSAVPSVPGTAAVSSSLHHHQRAPRSAAPPSTRRPCR